MGQKTRVENGGRNTGHSEQNSKETAGWHDSKNGDQETYLRLGALYFIPSLIGARKAQTIISGILA
jgi:hypothetical protein